MNVLVITTDYPKDKSVSMQFVHTRNLHYKEHGIKVKVLNFNAKENYIKDGIEVISLNFFNENYFAFKDYILISHAPNVRQHFPFVEKNRKIFKHIIFIFHGHEVVPLNKAYPKDYTFVKKGFVSKMIRSIYDIYKLKKLKKYFEKIDLTSTLVFVSNSLKADFIKYTDIDTKKIEDRCYIINNIINENFLKLSYDEACNKEYDFITVRSNLDSSVYCIDLVRDIAISRPQNKFLIIGKGEFFKHYSLPNNVTFINDTLSHDEIVRYTNKSKCALMPTRRDSQGVMSCELATFGIPLITSNLNVCIEMLSDFENVSMCSEEEIKGSIDKNNYIVIKDKNLKFSKENTVMKEINLIESKCGKGE